MPNELDGFLEILIPVKSPNSFISLIASEYNPLPNATIIEIPAL